VERYQVLAASTRVVNIGAELRERLDAVARLEQLDATSLGRRIIEAAVVARERASSAAREERDYE
jgi:hypothetical protein